MITANQIAPYKVSVDNEKTEEIKSELLKAQQYRQPFYLTSAEFDKILKWKLRSQYFLAHNIHPLLFFYFIIQKYSCNWGMLFYKRSYPTR